MRLRRLPFVLLGLGALLILMETARPEPRGYWAPDGFVSVADSLIRLGRLELHPGREADSIRPVFGTDSAAMRFFNESYLRGDVRAFNTDPRAPRTPFLVRDGVLRGVDSTYHRIDLPFGPVVRWLGDLRLTNRTPVTMLVGSEGTRLELRHPRSGDDTRPVRVRLPGRNAAAGGARFELLAPDGTEVLARLFYVGDAPVLEDARDRGEEAEIRLSGVGTERGFRYVLRGGDWINIRGPGSVSPGRPGLAVTFLVRRDAAARTLSFVRERNGRVSRVHASDRYEGFSEHVSQALDLALASEPRVRGLQERDLELTLDRELTGALDTLVLGSALCAAGDLDRPRSVSLLVMDAFSGRVQAMPSCPDAAELARWEPLPRRSRVRLLRNQNLVDHPIGSAGKPFWAAAVTTAHPNFLDLTIPGHETEHQNALFGCRLPSSYRDFPHPGPVDFERFLRASCNRYLVEMATATFAVREDPARPSRCGGELSAEAFLGCLRRAAPEDPDAGRISFCGREIPIVLSDELEGVETGCRLTGVRAAFDGTLPFERVTGARTLSREMPGAPRADTTSPGARFRLGRYRVDVWRELLREFEAAGSREISRTALRFASVVPEATNLELNTVEELRRDWLNLLLGGENSRWSNLELAEATARLVTGREVRASLASRFADSLTAGAPPAGRFAPLGPSSLHPGARRRVLHALELVWREGTAAALAPQIERLAARTSELGYELYAFAKTGTANVQKPVPSRALRALHDLSAAGEIGWVGDSLAILDGAESRRLDPAWRRSLTRRYLSPVAADPARFTVGPDASVAHPVTLTPAGRPVVPLRNDALEDREGGVLLLGLLAVPEGSGRERAARVRDWITACPDLDEVLRRGILEIPPVELLDPEESVALTAAFFADDLPPEGSVGSQVAVGLARETFDPIGDYLLAEVERKRR